MSTKMKLMIKASLAVAITLSFLYGCGNQRSADTVAISKAYSDFRAALVARDFSRATNFMPADYLELYPDPAAKVAEHFGSMTNADMELKSDSWVRFDRKDSTKAWLFPHRAPAVGRGLVYQTNGWKIMVDVFPIVD